MSTDVMWIMHWTISWRGTLICHGVVTVRLTGNQLETTALLSEASPAHYAT